MNPEKLKKLQNEVRIGGKVSVTLSTFYSSMCFTVNPGPQICTPFDWPLHPMTHITDLNKYYLLTKGKST